MTRLHRPPAVPLVPLIWHSLRERNDINKAYMRFFEKHGDIVWMHRPGISAYLVSNPAYVKHLLADAAANNYPKNHLTGIRGVVFGESITSIEGARWKRHRRMVQPAFQRDKLLALVPKFAGAIERTLNEHWERFARSGEPIELMRETSRLSIKAMGQFVFSKDTPDDVCEAAFNYMRFAIRHRSLVEQYVPMPVKLAHAIMDRKFPGVVPSAHLLSNYVWEHVRAGMARGEPTDDLLGHLMTAKDESGAGFSELEIRDEAIDFLFGGHISPGISLAWTWYCLHKYGEVRERMFDTVDRALGGRLPTAQDLPALQYVNQVYEETLRHYSTAPGVSRPAIMDDKIGDYDVPKGTVVIASAYVMHRHPAYWKDPYTFNPGNFEPELSKARPRYVYIPFGGGQRVCIGAQMAMLFAAVSISMIAQRYRLEVMPDKPVEGITGGGHFPKNLWVKVLPAQGRKTSSAPSPVSAVA